MDTQSAYFARDYRLRGGYYERFQLQLSSSSQLIFNFHKLRQCSKVRKKKEQQQQLKPLSQG